MGNARVVLNMSGVRQMLNDPDVISDCMARGERIAGRANEDAPKHGYRTEPFTCEEGTTSRGNKCAVVFARTTLGKRLQAAHSALTKSLDAGR